MLAVFVGVWSVVPKCPVPFRLSPFCAVQMKLGDFRPEFEAQVLTKGCEAPRGRSFPSSHLLSSAATLGFLLFLQDASRLFTLQGGIFASDFGALAASDLLRLLFKSANRLTLCS